jgi:hypothetical protein
MLSSPIKDDIYGQKKKFDEVLNIFDRSIQVLGKFEVYGPWAIPITDLIRPNDYSGFVKINCIYFHRNNGGNYLN